MTYNTLDIGQFIMLIITIATVYVAGMVCIMAGWSPYDAWYVKLIYVLWIAAPFAFGFYWLMDKLVTQI